MLGVYTTEWRQGLYPQGHLYSEDLPISVTYVYSRFKTLRLPQNASLVTKAVAAYCFFLSAED